MDTITKYKNLMSKGGISIWCEILFEGLHGAGKFQSCSEGMDGWGR